MRSGIKYMGFTHFVRAAAGALLLATAASCADQPLDDWKKEFYTRNFIKQFGLIDPEQDWNMAKEGSVTINVGDQRTDLKVYSKYGNKYYLVADLKGMRGQFKVPFDVPKACTEVMVNIGGKKYYGNIGDVIVCTDHPASRSSEVDGKFVYAPTDPTFSKTAGNATVSISPIADYLYFNAMQMGPITRKDDWPSYWSYGDRAYKRNDYIGNSDGKGKGILPEIGEPNQHYDQGNANKHPDDVKEDFVFQMKDPTIGFEIYPMFYGSNLRHTLGVYLLDNDKKPLRVDPTNPNSPIIKYPIYTSKYGDDIQVKEDAPTRAKVATIRFIDTRTNAPLTKDASNHSQVKLRVGETVDIRVEALNMYGEILDGNYNLNENNEASYISYTLNNAACQNHTGRIISITGNSESGNDVKQFKTTPKITINVMGKEEEYENKDYAEMPFNVIVEKRQSPVKKIKVFDGNNAINEVEVYQEETKTFDVKIYSDSEGTSELDWNTYKNDISLTPWHTDMFTVSLDTDDPTLSITGIGSGTDDQGNTIWAQWKNLYVNDAAFDQNDTRNWDLHITVKPIYTYHTASTTYTGNDDSYDSYPATTINNPTWQSYFYTQAEADEANGTSGNAPQRRTKSVPKSRAPRTVTIWEGTQAFYWTQMSISSEHFSEAKEGDKIIFTFTKSEGFLMQLDYPLSLKESSIESPYTYTLTAKEIGNFSNGASSIPVNGTGFTLTKVEMELANGSAVEAGEWKPGAKAQMEADLESYYKSLELKLNCGETGHSDQISSPESGVTRTVNVSVTGDNQSEAAYSVTVTLTKKERIVNPAPRRNSKAKTKKSAAYKPASRAEAGSQAEWDELTAKGGALSLYNDDGSEATWLSINKVYTNVAKTTDAYVISDIPMLVRSRGYRVIITGPDGKPWQGYFGMYIDWEWGDYDSPDATVVSYLNNPANGRPLSGTHFSQSALNLVVDGEHEYPISYAASFKHPKSTNEYLCFEDWPVTKVAKAYDPNKTGDVDLKDHVATGDYTAWDWGSATGDYSSDRDLNDIIYRQVGLVATRTKDLAEEAKGFSWIWALEDLGSTDDFDFNDLVMRITSITTSQEVDGQDDPVVVKKITFQPLAAGGTLPIYVHFKYTDSQNVTTDYVLRPGEFNLNGTHDLSTSDGLEYHKWFGNQYTSLHIINTQKNRNHVSEANIRKCELIVPKTFKINGVPQHGSPNTNNNYVTMDGNGAQFYVTINGPTTTTTQENVNGNNSIDRLDDETYAVSMPLPGEAAQSFIIVEQRHETSSTSDSQSGVTTGGTNNSQDYAKPWYWPTERTHILEAYPRFKDWLSNPENQTWYLYENAVEKFIFKL